MENCSGIDITDNDKEGVSIQKITSINFDFATQFVCVNINPVIYLHKQVFS